MRGLINLKRDYNYYFGLLLLIAASLSLVWAIWQDAFEPKDFLVYFLIYGWGYILLLKSDTEYRLDILGRKITEMTARIENLEEKIEEGGKELRPFSDDLNDVACAHGKEPGSGTELFQELWGEEPQPREKTEDDNGDTGKNL